MKDVPDEIAILRSEESPYFSYLQALDRYNRQHIADDLAHFDIEAEIAILSNEMESIGTKSLPWEAGDFVTAFIAGVLGGLIDVFMGKPSTGYSENAEPGSLFGKPIELKISTDSFFGLGKHLKKYDLLNNPIDKQIPGASLGNHRLYSYGHDLLRFFKGVQLILTGKGPVGLRSTGVGGELWLENSAWQTPESFLEAVLIVALHLYKDFWSARSLPIPGCTIIANLNDNKMPELAHELVNNRDVNLRVMMGQALAVSVIEITIRIWIHVKYRDAKDAPEDIKAKCDKMLLLGQSIGLAFNIGKIVVTKNPFFLSVPQMLRIVGLSVAVLKEAANLRHRALNKAEMAMLRTKYETLKTLVLLDETLYYTNQIDRFIILKRRELEEIEQQNESLEDKGFADIAKQLDALRGLGKEVPTR